MVSGAGVVQYPASPSLQFGTMVTRFRERPRRNATTKWPASWIARIPEVLSRPLEHGAGQKKRAAWCSHAARKNVSWQGAYRQRSV